MRQKKEFFQTDIRYLGGQRTVALFGNERRGGKFGFIGTLQSLAKCNLFPTCDKYYSQNISTKVSPAFSTSPGSTD